MTYYACPVCSHRLEPYGTGGMVCQYGHHYTREQVQKTRPKVTTLGKRKVSVQPWIPGAVLGGLALLVEVVRVVLGG